MLGCRSRKVAPSQAWQNWGFDLSMRKGLLIQFEQEGGSTPLLLFLRNPSYGQSSDTLIVILRFAEKGGTTPSGVVPVRL